MGVIKKKAATRGTEGGMKFICDVCSADITSTVRIRCADPACSDYDLCVPCFSKAAFSREHDPATHPYSVIEQHSIPIYVEDWGADEELLLLEGAETYGLGSWAEIADHIGGFRTKDEVRDHYIDTYVNSPNFPLPARADPKDLSLLKKIPREEFHIRKKRRIEERKEAAKNAPPNQPKQKPTTSVPSCHEVQGFMPGRLEFEAEFANEAEEYVQHMQFEPGEGADPVTHAMDGPMDPETELKMVVMDVYNARLTQRAVRKKIIFEHNLLDYRKNAAQDKKRTKEERDILNKTKPFTRMCNHNDYIDFSQGIEYEHNLRQAIAQLQDWRANQLIDLREGEEYEVEKAQRLSRPPPTGQFDRMGGVRSGKPTAPVETPSTTAAFIAPDLPERLKSSLRPVGITTQHSKPKALAEITINVTPAKCNYTTPPIPGVSPMKLTTRNATSLGLLNPEERELCSVTRIMPKSYLAIKEGLLREAVKTGGVMKRKEAKAVTKLDGPKMSRIFDYFVHSGWIKK